MTLRHLFELLLSPVLSALMISAILWLFKIPKTLLETSKTIEILTTRLSDLTISVQMLVHSCDRLEKRMDITDRVISDMIQQSYDSKIISEDKSKYPQVKKRDS